MAQWVRNRNVCPCSGDRARAISIFIVFTCGDSANMDWCCCICVAFTHNTLLARRANVTVYTLGRASFLLSLIKIYFVRTPPHMSAWSSLALASRRARRFFFLAFIRYAFNWTGTFRSNRRPHIDNLCALFACTRTPRFHTPHHRPFRVNYNENNNLQSHNFLCAGLFRRSRHFPFSVWPMCGAHIIFRIFSWFIGISKYNIPHTHTHRRTGRKMHDLNFVERIMILLLTERERHVQKMRTQ